jgi:hypothetical protein
VFPRLSFLLVLSLLLCCSFADQKPISARDKAEVHGTVRDVTGAWATMTAITFRSRNSSYEVQTNEKGDYSVLLPAGTYTLSARQLGFCELRRAEFIAPAGSQIDFDLQLWVCPTDSYGWDNYTELTGASSGALKPLIFYGQSKNVHDSRVFTGPGGVADYPAVLTFNRHTFIADRFTYAKGRNVIVADGKVSWYMDSDKPNHASQIEIRFDRTTPRVTVLAM